MDAFHALPPALATERASPGDDEPLGPATLNRLFDHLARHGREAFTRIDGRTRAAAWHSAIAALHTRGTSTSAVLRSTMTASTGLSPEGLDAALENVLAGCVTPNVQPMFETATVPPHDDRGVAFALLAANVPGLAAQVLLPALVAGRPTILRSSSREPWLAPQLVRALTERVPALRDAIAAVTWPGGDDDLDPIALQRASHVVAFGSDATLGSIAGHAGTRLIGFGTRISLAIVGSGLTERSAVANGLAQDIALFDQRGCLSIQAIYTDDDPEELARALATALDRIAVQLPMGVVEPRAAAQVQQLRAEAALTGLVRPEQPLRHGTVVVDPDPTLRPSPGLRTVRVHRVETLDTLPSLLTPWTGRLQGVALAGSGAEALAPALAALGANRFAPPGSLQAAGAGWHNGGIDLAAALGSSQADSAA